MTVFAGDHSTAGAIIGGSLRRAGMQGLIRYACGGRGDVNITPAEVRDLKANGIPLGIVVEHQANWMLLGGVADRVRASRDVWRACGVPDGVIYLAADFDVTNGGPTSPGSPGDRNMYGIAAALDEAATVVGRDNVGFYGSYFACVWLMVHRPWIKWYWQTLAWSEGNRHPRPVYYQQANSVNVAGCDVDVDQIWHPNWGQRTDAPHPVPPPAPHPNPLAILDHSLQTRGTRKISEYDRVQHVIGALKQPKNYHDYLHTLEDDLHWLMGRLYEVAKVNHPLPNGHGSWGANHRGERYQLLGKYVTQIEKTLSQPPLPFPGEQAPATTKGA